MKRNYIYLACMTVCMFALFAISSCSNEMDMPSSKIEHLQKMKQLCAQYGWTQIEGVSQEEVDKFLLSEDYEKTKEFFEFVKTGGWKSHATLTLLATQDLPTFGYNMIDPLKSWCWGSILFYPFKISRFS